MMTEAEVRAQAAKAAATCAVAVGLGDASGFLRVAGMIETFINQGAGAAQAVIASWSTPAAEPVASPQAGDAQEGGPTVSRAQELASEAYSLETRQEIQAVIVRAEDEGVSADEVTMGYASGPLINYLEHLMKSMPPVSDVTARNDLGLGSNIRAIK